MKYVNHTYFENFLEIIVIFLFFCKFFSLFNFFSLKKKNIFKNFILNNIFSFYFYLENRFFLFFFVFFIRSFLFEIFYVPSRSMKPLINRGDLIYVEKFTYRIIDPLTKFILKENKLPKHMDVILFKKNKKEFFVKRIIGIPGDFIYKNLINKEFVIFIDKDKLEKLQENINLKKKIKLFRILCNFLIEEKEKILNYDKHYIKIKIPKNKYFVIGDNCLNSFDSRFIGLISLDDIIGKFRFVLFNIFFKKLM
ncbi:MAG: signal peptidase I [Enterobacteriaceae bacterium]